jgi:hypothetical protein
MGGTSSFTTTNTLHRNAYDFGQAWRHTENRASGAPLIANCGGALTAGGGGDLMYEQISDAALRREIRC